MHSRLELWGPQHWTVADTTPIRLRPKRKLRHSGYDRLIAPSPELLRPLQNFFGTLDSLWQIATNQPRLDLSDDFTESADLFDRFIHGSEDPETTANDVRRIAEAIGNVLEQATSDADSEHPGNYSVEVEGVSHTAEQLIQHLIQRVTRPPLSSLVYRSILPMAIGTFEVLLGEVAAQVFREFPGLLDSSDRRFSLSDLESFETIEDARSRLIDERVESLLRGSIFDWAKWLEQSPLALKLESLSSDWGGFQEIFLRRNIIVHNNSVVNRRYLSGLQSSSDDSPQAGTELETNLEYTTDAIDRLTASGLLVGSIASYKLTSNDVSANLLSDVKLLLDAGRWLAAYEISRVAERFRDIPASAKMDFKLARLLSTKHLVGPGPVHDEVAALDLTTTRPGLQACFFAIADRLDEARDAIGRAISSGELSTDNVRFSPYLRSVQPATDDGGET